MVWSVSAYDCLAHAHLVSEDAASVVALLLRRHPRERLALVRQQRHGEIRGRLFLRHARLLVVMVLGDRESLVEQPVVLGLAHVRVHDRLVGLGEQREALEAFDNKLLLGIAYIRVLCFRLRVTTGVSLSISSGQRLSGCFRLRDRDLSSGREADLGAVEMLIHRHRHNRARIALAIQPNGIHAQVKVYSSICVCTLK